MRLSILATLSLISSAFAQNDGPVRAVQAACDALNSVLPGKVSYPNSTAYANETADYWGSQYKAKRPICIAFPGCTEDVSKTIRTLNLFPTVLFAVKSGGHDANPFHSSVDNGVLVALSSLNSTSYDAAKGVAYVQPGQHWVDVIGALKPYNVTVVGGRLSIVGVGGYIAGGGLSFLSAQHGLAADTVQEFEVVQGSGNIAKVNAQSNKDLFRAMKGSSNQYGVITQYSMKAIPIGQVWGGTRVYLPTAIPALMQSLYEFTANPADKKAAIIINVTQLGGGITIAQVFYFYDGPAPSSDAFRGLLDIPFVQEAISTRSYLDLLESNSVGGGLTAGSDPLATPYRASWRSQTLPLAANATVGVDFFQRTISTWQNITAPFMASNNDSVLTLAFQSWPSSIGVASAAAGGNAMGLTANDKPRYVLELAGLWGTPNDSSQDATVYGNAKKTTDAVVQMNAEMVKAQNGTVEQYNPFFLNDAAYDQDVMGSYREYPLFKALQRGLDPLETFSRRVGGFKY